MVVAEENELVPAPHGVLPFEVTDTRARAAAKELAPDLYRRAELASDRANQAQHGRTQQ